MDMFYDLLICAVNPSVCLQWGGSGQEEWEGGIREAHFVRCVGGKEVGHEV